MAVVVLIAACSGSGGPGARHADRGERVIEDVVAPQLGLGPLSASCEADDALVFGDQFTCTGVSDDGREVVFLATIADGGAIDVTSLNLITDEVIASIEVAAIDSLRRSDGLEVAVNGFKCGVGPVVFPVGEEFAMLCRVLHPSTGLVHSAAVEITDLANLELRVIISPDPG